MKTEVMAQGNNFTHFRIRANNSTACSQNLPKDNLSKGEFEVFDSYNGEDITKELSDIRKELELVNQTNP